MPRCIFMYNAFFETFFDLFLFGVVKDAAGSGTTGQTGKMKTRNRRPRVEGRYSNSL